VTKAPVLIIGGSGIVGAEAVRTLRRLQPDLPIAVGGRDLAKAQAVAAEVGGAEGLSVDLSRRDLGLGDAPFSAVAIFLKDQTLNSMKFAQDRAIPYLSLSSGTFEMGPEVAAYITRPDAAPVLLASQWLVGVSVLPTLAAARAFSRLDSIRIGLLLDEEDMGGPAAYADYERIVGIGSSALVLEDGAFRWIPIAEGKGFYRRLDGETVETDIYGPFDVLSLAAATDARDIRVGLALGVSSARAAGRPFAHELAIELEGLGLDGAPLNLRRTISHPRGQGPITALGVALSLERLLGLKGEAPAAGLYLPEHLIDPDDYLKALTAFGGEVVDA
jgi:hypothetical protein